MTRPWGRRWWWRWSVRCAIGGAAVAGGLIVVALFVRAWCDRQMPAPGRFVSIGDRQLHAIVAGRGGPTVVLEAGAGEYSLVWDHVQRALARHTTVVAYDRAGLGWSESAETDDVVLKRAVLDLNGLLANLDAPRPYILVGHSLGGYLVRVWAARRPDLVAGIVLVDASHEEQWRRLPAEYTESARAQLASLRRQATVLLPAMDAGLVALRPGLLPSMPGLRAPVAETYRWRFARSGAGVRSLLAELDAGWSAMPGALQPLPCELVQVPLRVLVHGRTDVPEDNGVLERQKILDTETVWQHLQNELAALSNQGEVEVVADAAHHIHLDRPDAVVRAIQDVIDAVRSAPSAGATAPSFQGIP